MDSSLLFEAPFSLYSSQTEYTIQLQESAKKTTITRENNEIVFGDRDAELKGRGEEFWGVVGIAHFPASSYLVIISKGRFIGNIKDASVFQVTEISFKPYK